MKNARDAAAITAVAAQPQIAIDRDSVSRPMTLGLRTINIITAISGAREHPVDHRRPIEGAHRIKANEAKSRAEQRGNRYRRIEGAGIVGSGVESACPAEHLANRIGRRSCQHRDCQQSGADDPGGEQRKRELARDGP